MCDLESTVHVTIKPEISEYSDIKVEKEEPDPLADYSSAILKSKTEIKEENIKNELCTFHPLLSRLQGDLMQQYFALPDDWVVVAPLLQKKNLALSKEYVISCTMFSSI